MSQPLSEALRSAGAGVWLSAHERQDTDPPDDGADSPTISMHSPLWTSHEARPSTSWPRVVAQPHGDADDFEELLETSQASGSPAPSGLRGQGSFSSDGYGEFQSAHLSDRPAAFQQTATTRDGRHSRMMFFRGKKSTSAFSAATFGPGHGRRVRFQDKMRDDSRANGALTVRRGLNSIWVLMLSGLERLETLWSAWGRPLVVVTSLFEIWSMGIWLGFARELEMARSLRIFAIIDMSCTFLYIVDQAFLLLTLYLDQVRIQRAEAEANRKHHRRRRSQMEAAKKEGEAKTMKLSKRERLAACFWSLFSHAMLERLQVVAGGALALSMVPVELLLYQLLSDKRSDGWEIVVVLCFRLARVLWVFRDCAKMINHQEMEVYVDIRMHGTSGSSWNRARILSKQFLIVIFFGHWFGCLSYALHVSTKAMQEDIRYDNETSRDYFSKFSDNSNIYFIPGESFWDSYILSVYKGFNLNYEDLLPERPFDLCLEVLGSVMILLMKSYCIGSFFKYHQKREMEVARFSQLMDSVTQYMNLYELPQSLRKTIVGYFRFQQANHRKIKTLEVISQLPIEVQKKLREQETLPLVVDRNPAIFGQGISSEYCMEVAVSLSSQFLQPGEVIFLESEIPRELVFLESGSVSFSRKVVTEGRSTERLMRYVRADRKDDASVLGAVSVILGCPHFFSARVRAGADAIILNTSREKFAELNAKYPDQHDLLVKNAAETVLLDYKGKDLQGVEKTGEQENETFNAIRQDVRLVLQARQDSLNASFTYAATNGDVKLVKELLGKRIEANVSDYDRRSALHLAAAEGMAEVLEALLEASGDPNTKDRWGSTPMRDALKHNFMGAAKLLKKHGGELSLLDPAGDLCTFASEGNTIQMQQLLDFGVNPNSGDYDARTALHLSASEGHLPVITFLTSRKADVNIKDRWNSTPMMDAVRNGFAIAASHLKGQGGRVDEVFAAECLCTAASQGNMSTLQMLFETGVEMNQADYDQRTALHLVAAEGQVLALDYLVNTARAAHSPCDRWKSTPLQDALNAGHELCVRILMAVGADLGPSASEENRKNVQDLSDRMGFGQRQGITSFAELTTGLRRHLGSHLSLVSKGKARGDIFDTHEAAKFNKHLIHESFKRMRTLCEDASWLANLLQTFEAAAEPIWQLQRLIRDADTLSREAKYWGDVLNLESRRQKRKSKDKKRKDANDMVFHKAFVGTMRYSQQLVSLVEDVARRIVTKVEVFQQEHLHSETYEEASAPVSLSRLVAEELMVELGLINEHNGEVERLRQGGPNQHMDILVEDVVDRLEEIAGVLLPGEHMALSLFRGALFFTGKGVLTGQHDPSLSTRGSNPVMAPLSKWLEMRTRATLSGKVSAATETKPPKGTGSRLMHCMYGSLFNLESDQQASQKQPVNRLMKSFSQAAMKMDGETAMTWLVASELALIGVTAMVLEGWDKDAKLGAAEREVLRKTKQKNEESFSPQKRSGSRALQADKLRMADIEDLGRVCRETSLVCRGLKPDSGKERGIAMKVAQKQMKDQKKKAKEEGEFFQEKAGSVSSADDEQSHALAPSVISSNHSGHAPLPPEKESDSDDDDERKEHLPIRVSKILALKGKMSLDEMTILVDVDDTIVHKDGHKPSVFGEMSRERFTLNLLRCIINHDEAQKDVLGSVKSQDVEAEIQAEEANMESFMQLGWRSLPILPKEEAVNMTQEIDAMQRKVSEEGIRDGEDDDEDWRQGEIGPGMIMQVPGAFGQSAEDMLEEEEKRKRGKYGICGWICRTCGAEGRKRRKEKRIAKKFRELDDDGDGIGAAEMAVLLAVAFNHSLGQDLELRYAYRVFELLNKADVGDSVRLQEFLEILPALEEEVKDQQRKNRRGGSVEGGDRQGAWAVTRLFSRMVISPDSQMLKAWDIMKHLVVIYYLLEVPWRFCFLSRVHVSEGALAFFDSLTWFCDIFMAINMVLNFFRAFIHPTQGVVTGFEEIRKQYVFGLFSWDLVACLPMDAWLDEENGSSGIFARPRAGLRLLRLLHLRHLAPSSQHQSNEANRGFYYAAISMSMSIITIVHFFACFYWLLGTRYDNFDEDASYTNDHNYDKWANPGRGSWTYSYMHRPGEPPIGRNDGSAPYWWQYLVSFHWTAGRITSQSSPGNLLPASWMELGWTCVLFLVNVAINGYCDGILVDKVIAGDEQAIEAKAMRKIVDEYLQTADLPPELIKDIRQAAENSGRVVERQRMENTIAALPHSLKQRVAHRIFLPHFKAEIFQGCSDRFLVELGTHCRIMGVGKDSPLAAKGEPAEMLIVLLAGRIGVINEAGNQMAETSTPGEMVGEMPFVFELKHVISLVALEDSRIMVLSKSDFKDTCAMYPEDAMSLKRGAMKVIQALSGQQEEDDRASQGQRSKKGSNSLTKAKSTLSFVTTSSAGSSASMSMQSTTVSHALRRMYAGDLKLVVDKLRQDQVEARQELICNFVQQAADGDLNRVEAILQKGEVLVDEGDYDLRTALHLATCSGHLAVVKHLVEKHNANINLKDRFGSTPIDDGVREKRKDIVQYFVSKGAHYQADESVAAQLCQAAYDNDVDTLKLMTQDVRVNPNLSDYDFRTALHLGASEGHLGVVQQLCSLRQIDLSPRDRLGNTPLDDAMRHQHAEVRRYLHAQGAKMGAAQLGITLCEMAWKGDLDGLRELADSDVAMSEADYDYRTALHLAASENHLSIVTFLLQEAKINPNPLDRSLNTPLDDAIRHNHVAMNAFLTDYGGMRGSDPRMKPAVAEFKARKKAKDEALFKEKLTKEIKVMEVATLHAALQKIREHPTLEDDINTFVANVLNYRTLLLHLLRGTEMPAEEKPEKEHDDMMPGFKNREDEDHTKVMRERVLTILIADMDNLAARLTTTLETDVLSWLQGLSRHEEKILKLFTPDLKAATLRAVEHLKQRARMAKFTQHLWKDTGKEEGYYICTAVGLLFNRVAEAPMDIVQRARLEAQALLWVSDESLGPDARAKRNHAWSSMDHVEDIIIGAPTAPKERKSSTSDNNQFGETVYRSLALRGMIEDDMMGEIAKEKNFGMEEWQHSKML